jgi:DNA polymerase I-like protein with 3'-5' exonuclease and polymerase domains
VNKKDFRLVTSSPDIALLVETLSKAEYVGFDTETTGLDPHTCKLRLIQMASAEACFVVDCFALSVEQMQPLLALLMADKPVKVAHNAKFDAAFVLRHYNVELGEVFDTMLASQLASAGNEEDRHSLEMCVKRYLGWQLDKEEQTSDWSGELKASQLEYAALDAMVVLALHEKLRDWLKQKDLEVAAQLEFDCVVPLAAMELAGVYLDRDCWRRQVERIKAEHDRVATDLQQQLSGGASQMALFTAGPQINLDSPQQVRDALARLGIRLESTSEWHLQRQAKQFPILERLIEYRHLSKSLHSYGESILEFINPVTGRIHANFRQIGTPTGRMSCSSPSLQQIPHAPEYRSCFRAAPGCKLIIADYSQIELRILADFAKDQALIAAFTSGEDLHRATASQMLGISLGEVTSQQREYAKRLNYGIIYGMGAEGLAGMLEISVDEASKLIEKYFAAYSGVAKWLSHASESAVREGRSRTASGRLWVYKFDENDPQQLAQTKRVGRNTPIQGTSADILKRAMRLVHEGLRGKQAQLINSVHDELVVECDETLSAELAPTVSASMIRAGREFVRRVPVIAEAVIADTWVKK